jgi:integrase
MAAALTPELADLLTFIHATGCRPKEARTIEARHLDRAERVAVLVRHKTAHKTGKKRVIYLPEPAAEVAFRLADLRPEGPIFLNTRGRPWTHNALGLAVRRLRKRAGLTGDMVAYAFRHGFATDALTRGISSALVAELMGHADLRMLHRYAHLSDKHDALREAVAKVRGEAGPEPAGS